ncbi:hypothetical protein CRI77_00300 [Mycolicibacterium duvalii]|uniref:Uncharacterized protein n=1 Tax=Mycolicibacterium duvalii TaxID=39688 RepID=A0A7I7K554_9MYCO|nr:DUF4129 domain-containing protein [Mycolicibacterium duvalii]MCV7368842.1 DUF4129 domain-containing protein [Mycolicibacterium duvalii]PEG44346.1 hypothetical protein CRI77_00300 [Mycolicibacterium duvalii]BBX19260.1 hypothetical protein MDUV_41200 [Mycolicibacterium duvalii]
MPGDGKAVARKVAVLVAVLLSALALRGYLPGDQPDPPPRQPDEGRGGGSAVAVVAMFAVALAIMTLAVFAQPRRRRAGHTEEPPRRRGGAGGPLRWRLLAFAAVVMLVWLAVLLLLQRWEVDVPDADGAAAGGSPPDDAGGADPGTTPPAEGSDTLFGYFLAGTIAMLLLSIVAGIRGRRGRPAPAPPVDDDGHLVAEPPSAGAPDLARAAELGLAEIGDRSRDPRDAIIACYAAMERELEKSPDASPRASDTPSEVLARAVERRVLRAGSAAELVELFEEARFSRHVMTEQHRDDALVALRSVQRELQEAQ